MSKYTFQGDNYRFDITATGADLLKLALEVAFIAHSRVRDIKEKDNTLILYWAKDGVDMRNDLMALDLEATYTIVKEWLDNKCKYSPEPDIDGDSDKGFRVYNEAWGHIGSDWRAFCAIKPTWMMYGK